MNRAACTQTLVLLCLISIGTGCIPWSDKNGTRHMVVIGLGFVSIHDSNPTAATVVRAQTMGVTADAQGVVAGYSSRFVTAIPNYAEDVRIEASKYPFTPIKIEVQKAQITKTNQTEINKETK